MKHGHASGGFRTPEYLAWMSMRLRCLNPRYKNYKNYGGRGITICPEWEDFAQFFKDVGLRPTNKHSLDRIDNEGNYEPSNVRWSTPQEQQRNRRNNRILIHEGVAMPLSAWAEKLGVPDYILKNRVYRGWTTEKVLTEPLRSGGYNVGH